MEGEVEGVRVRALDGGSLAWGAVNVESEPSQVDDVDREIHI